MPCIVFLGWYPLGITGKKWKKMINFHFVQCPQSSCRHYQSQAQLGSGSHRLVLVMPIASGITLHILPFLSQGKIKLHPLTARKAMTWQPGIQLFICWLYIAKKLYLELKFLKSSVFLRFLTAKFDQNLRKTSSFLFMVKYIARNI